MDRQPNTPLQVTDGQHAADGSSSAGSGPLVDRTPRYMAVLLVLCAVGFVASFSLQPDDPPVESLDNATFFADRASTTTTTAAVVTGAEVAQTEATIEAVEPEWPRLLPEPGAGTLIATSLEPMTAIEVWAGPDDAVPSLWQLAIPTEFGGPRTFLVLSETEDWVEVKVPVRPNGSTGWVRKSDVSFTLSTMRIEVDVSDRTVVILDGDTPVFETVGAVGRDAYPTPVGEWFLRDAIAWDPNSVYGPWVLALSAFSEQIDEINGGQAVVALHGTSQPDKLGSAVSLGCVRLSNDDITTVASLVPVGSPVIITA